MLELTLAFIGLALSAFFSGSELAFISANPLQMEVWSKQERRGAARAIRLMGNPGSFLVSVLVGTTLSNVVATSFATVFLVRLGWHPIVVLVVITSTILLFGEVLPKTLSGERPNHFLRVVAPLQRPWILLFAPVAVPLRKISGHFDPGEHAAPGVRTRRTRPRRSVSSKSLGQPQETTLEREDLKLLFASQKDTRVLLESEKELITHVFDLGETPVSKAMTPRTDICAVSEADELDKVKHTFIESGYSKLPVYRDNLDNIIGVVYLYDIFKAPSDLASIILPVIIIPDSNTTMDVLKQLQRARHPIAIVLDEYGGTAGLVTPEDLFEGLFGDFEDEFDSQVSEAAQLPDGSVLVDGKTKVEELNRQFRLNIPEGEYETIAGYLTAALDRIPYKGERIYLPFGQVVIRKATPQLIEKVQIYPGASSKSASGG
ncbi:MAG: HlyC/CorC family transporter [Fidelibacterota bacterium]|nr:MAG: HlyC/CorC family transporter [Candidatus Neomarinimicrobiota bacterium]